MNNNNYNMPNGNYNNNAQFQNGRRIRTVQHTQLTPNEIVMVKGKVVFSRITRLIDGEELQRDIQRRKNMNSFPINRPYTTITISDAEVQHQHNQPTPAEIYVEESFYLSANPDVTGNCYTVTNKSSVLPYLAQKRQGTTNECDQVQPEGEPAKGLEVVLQLRVFQSRQFARNAITLDGVIAQEPIIYYSGNDNASRLAAAGVIYHPLPADQQPKVNEPLPGAPLEEGVGYPLEDAPEGMPMQGQAGAPMGAPMGAPSGAPVAAPTGDPYRNDSERPAYGYPSMGNGNPYAQQPQGGPQGGGLRYPDGSNNY